MTFSDNFNRADGSPGAGWVQVSGTWSIVSNQLSPGAAGGTIVIRAATAMATSDHSAQVTIAATTSASQGVWCRGDATLSQGYLWRNNGTSWSLFSVVGGTFTSIGTYSAAAAAGDIAKIQVIGSTIKGFVNGVERLSVVNSAVTTGTAVGVRSDSTSGLKYDDFVAQDSVTTATLGIASAGETAQTLVGTKSATLNPAIASASAQTLVGTKSATLNPATAVGIAQSVAGTKSATLNPATAAGTAQALAGTKSAPLNTAGVVETSQSLAGTKSAILGSALVSEAAQTLTGGKHAVLAPAGAATSAQAVTGTKTAALGVAGISESTGLLVGTKTSVLPDALEAVSAHGLQAGRAMTPSPERTCTIPAESRRLTVTAESRRCTVAAESRTLTVR
jgi:hypothetical protein